MRAKYVRFEDDTIVIFTAHVNHDEMASCVKKKPISAGFIQISINDEENPIAFAYGHSESLQLTPLKDDNFFLNYTLQTGEYS